MAWLKVDNRLPSHPKFRAINIMARWLWVEGACYAAEYLTDGHPSSAVVAALVPELSRSKRSTAIAELKRVGLWERTSDGWEIHGYLDLNPSRKEVEGERAATRERVKAFRKRQSSNGVTNDTVTA